MRNKLLAAAIVAAALAAGAAATQSRILVELHDPQNQVSTENRVELARSLHDAMPKDKPLKVVVTITDRVVEERR